MPQRLLTGPLRVVNWRSVPGADVSS